MEFWARLKNAVNLPLRRGAWYRVISHTALEAVVTLEGDKTLSVPRPYLDIRAVRPTDWTVIRRSTVPVAAPDTFRAGYLVCPGCRKRVPLPPVQRAEQLCPRCGETFRIAWHERYMEDQDESR